MADLLRTHYSAVFILHLLLPSEQIARNVPLSHWGTRNTVVKWSALARTDYLGHWLCSLARPGPHALPQIQRVRSSHLHHIHEKQYRECFSERRNGPFYLTGRSYQTKSHAHSSDYEHTAFFSSLSSILLSSKFLKELFTRTKSFSDSEYKVEMSETMALSDLAPLIFPVSYILPLSTAQWVYVKKPYMLLHTSTPLLSSCNFPLSLCMVKHGLPLCVFPCVIFLVSSSPVSLAHPCCSHIIFPTSRRENISHNESADCL